MKYAEKIYKLKLSFADLENCFDDATWDAIYNLLKDRLDEKVDKFSDKCNGNYSDGIESLKMVKGKILASFWLQADE